MSFTILDNDESFNTNQSIWMQTDIDALVSGFNGDGVISGCAVTAQGSPDMTVAVGSGTIQISATSYSITGANKAITAADGSNPRIDLICANTSSALTVTDGTAAANPKAPDIPANSVLLAMVYVPASDTDIDSNQITDKRVIVLERNAGVNCRVTDAGNQTLTTTTWTDVNFDTEDYDTATFHDTVTNNERLTIPSDGKYSVGYMLQIDNNATGRRGARLMVDATNAIHWEEELSPDATIPAFLSGNVDFEFTTGQYVTVQAFQNSGGDLDIEQANDYSPTFWIKKIE
jgi:hypothetical protein